MESNSKVNEILKCCEKFSANLYKNATRTIEGNIVMSPLAAYLLLSMTVNGADGDTESQIRKVLYLFKDDLQSLQVFQILIDSLNSVSDIDVSVSSKMFISNKININPEFQSILENYFRNKAQQLDFSNKIEVVDNVNSWCKEETKNDIRQIISKDDVKDLSAMLLFNAIYFKGEWKYKFLSKNTKRERFHVNENSEKLISMMKQRCDLFYGELDFIDAKFVELPYESSTSNFKMVVIVPNKTNGLIDIENNLEHINYESLSKSAKDEKSVEVKLPVINFESTVNFEDCLKQMGIVDMFEKDRANFRKMQSEEWSSMWVDKIVQKALIEVNEEGTKASAVTFRSMLKLVKFSHPPPPPNKTLHADRPFLMIIMYEKLPLFYSRFTG